MAFGLGGLLGGGAVPDVQMPDGLPVSGGQGSPLVDAFLALQAQRIKDAVTAPQRSWTGELPIWDPATGHTTEEAQNAASGMAGLAMTGSMPFKAPAGAIRSFGGAAAHDDPLAALSAAMDHGIASAETVARPISRVDLAAPSWDLYHGTSAPTDFARFETNLPQAQRLHTPGSETGGVFLSPAPAEAAHYAGDIIGKDTIPGAGPRVIRTTVDPGKTDVFDLPHLLENDPAFVARARQAVIDENGGRESAGRQFDERHARMLDEFRSTRDLNAQLAEAGYPATEVPQVQWGYGAAGAAMQVARERGLDTAVLRGLSESNGGDQVVALTPGRVRSFYDPSQVLYSGGPGAAVGLPALASSSDPKGSSMSDGIPFGGTAPMFPGGMDPDQLAAVLRAIQSGQAGPDQAAPPPVDSPMVRALSGAPSMLGNQMPAPPMPALQQDAPVPSMVGAQAPAMPPLAAPQTTGALPKPPATTPDDEEDKPLPSPNAAARQAAPLPPSRPPELSSLADAARLPTSSFDPLTGQPTAGAPKPVAPPAPVADDHSFLKAWQALGNSGLGDQLLAMSAGFLNGGFGQAAQNLLSVSQSQGKGDLERLKLAKEQAALTGNAQILKRAYPNLSDAELSAMATNSANVTTALQILRDPTHGMPKSPEQMRAEAAATAAGTMEGGAKPLDRIKGEAQAAAEGSAAGKPEDTTADQKNYEEAKKGGYDGSFVDYLNMKGNASRAQTTINNTLNPILKGLGEQFVSSAENARSASEQVRAIQNARQQLDGPGGIISGFKAGDRLALQKVGALLGVTDPNAVQNTEALRAALKPMVLEAVKGLGSNPSNGDRTFAEDFSGGNIALDEGSIRRILDLNERSARARIERHNALADQMLETQPELKQVGPLMRIQAPEAAAAAQQQGAPQGSPQVQQMPAVSPIEAARAAIAAGADPNKVKTRLLRNGIDIRGL